MTSRPKLPEHGTVKRYRHELKMKAAGRGRGPCDRCRSANSERAKAARVNSTARARRSQMAIVGDVTSEGHSPTDDTAATGGDDKPPAPGVMELAVQQDIDEIDTALRVPFHRSLAALALESAREIDDPNTSGTARSNARKQLFDVLRSLRTTKEGGDGSALTVLLEQAGFGLPLVPGGPA